MTPHPSFRYAQIHLSPRRRTPPFRHFVPLSPQNGEKLTCNSCFPLGGKTKTLHLLLLFLPSPWGEGGPPRRWMRGFYLLFCEKGKTVFRIRFPFLTLYPFPKTPQNPHKVIPYSLFQSPLIFKGQRSLVAERI